MHEDDASDVSDQCDKVGDESFPSCVQFRQFPFAQFEVDEKGFIKNWKFDLDKFDAVWAN